MKKVHFFLTGKCQLSLVTLGAIAGAIIGPIVGPDIQSFPFQNVIIGGIAGFLVVSIVCVLIAAAVYGVNGYTGE